MKDISTLSSLISQFQPSDIEVMTEVKNVLENNQQELWINVNFLLLKEKLMKCSPIMLKRLTQISTLCDGQGKLALSIRKLCIDVINNVVNKNMGVNMCQMIQRGHDGHKSQEGSIC